MIQVIDTRTLSPDVVEDALLYIADNLREDDLAEARATFGRRTDIPAMLLESWQGSTHAWLILDRTGLPVSVFGVAPHLVEGVGLAWMVGTDGMLPEAIHIARHTPEYLAQMQDAYPALWANVDARNEVSMRWLEWAGFKILDANPFYGPEERLFIEFIRTA